MKTIKRRVLVVVLMLGTFINYANNGIEFKFKFIDSTDN